MPKEESWKQIGIRSDSRGLSRITATFLILVILILMIGGVAIFDIMWTTTHQAAPASSGTSGLSVSQPPKPAYVTLTWEKSPQALQDRFTPANIIVAQGDTVHITFIVNDTSAHTFTLSSPYNFQINVTVPGLTDDLTGQTFTSAATNNSPGVAISGTIGNLTGTGSFVAKYAGVYEYFCFYHVQIGMFGYLTVLPNAQYTASQTTGSTSQVLGSQVNIEYGSGADTTSVYFSPQTIVVVIGVNNTITWINNDIVAHTATSTGAFDSGSIPAGATWSYTFTTAGTYNYHCSYHSWMTGTVIVKSG